MIVIQNSDDFEFFSSNSAGAIQGAGYQCRNTGYVRSFFMIYQCAKYWHSHRPRLVRVESTTNWSIHDLILVDCKTPLQHQLSNTKYSTNHPISSRIPPCDPRRV